tara:strand:- start:978 stop:2273 length:1296 start_codon:yes stop_codon:yes gene_type:complete
MSTVTKIKDNFIDLIKNLPDDWELSKNKYAFSKITNGKNMSDITDVLSLTINGIQIKEDLTFGKTSKSYIGHQLVKAGDLVFTPRDFDQTPILSDVSKYDGCISNLYIVDRPNDEFLPEYINYFWHGLKYSFDYFKNFSYGIRFSFNREQFDEIPILKPSLNEQKIICTYLDDKLKHIDSLTKKIHRKINLLKEQKTSLINQCVTKGLNPNVEMKESGVEWIGKIPKHWEVTKIKYLCPNGVQYGLNSESDSYKEKGVRFVRTTDITPDGRLKDTGGVYLSSDDVPPEYFLQKNDILFSRSGSVGKSIRIRKSDPNMAFAGYLVRISFEDDDLSKFVKWISESGLFWNWIYIQSTKSTIPNVSAEKYSNFNFPLPSRDEIEAINLFLKDKIYRIDKNIYNLELKTRLLLEYHQSLISSVVTGKVRITKDML